MGNLHFISSLLNMGIWISIGAGAAVIVKKYNKSERFGTVTLFLSFMFVSLIIGLIITLSIGLPDTGLAGNNLMYVFGAIMLMTYFLPT